MDFFKQQFDKILLTVLVLTFSIMAYRAFHVSSSDMAAFAVDNAKLFSGALLTLITGRLIQKAAEDKPEPPKAAVGDPGPEVPKV